MINIPTVPGGFSLWTGQPCAVCNAPTPGSRVVFRRGDTAICDYCVAEIRGQEPDQPNADRARPLDFPRPGWM